MRARQPTHLIQGPVRSRTTTRSEDNGLPAGADRHDSPLLEPTLEAGKEQVGPLPEQVDVNLDRGYDSGKTRTALSELGFTGENARKGVPAPIQAGKRWVAERSHAWMNGYGELGRRTEKRSQVVDLDLYLSATIVTLRMVIRRAAQLYRWDNRPTTKRLK